MNIYLKLNGIIMMKPVLIVENSTNSLKLNESARPKDDKYILGGIFTEFGVKNRNDRVYTAPKFLPCLDELNERITTLGVVYGEFDHPDVFDTSLSRASHLIHSTSYIKESNRVEGEIRLLSTYWGREAKSLVNDGCPIFVSSRAAGVTESDGTVSLKKLFTYDIVADPGFGSAKMHVKTLNESLGYKNPSANFRIYEMSDESKINELFDMNKNDYVTKKQLTEYSLYLGKELASTKKEVTSAVTKGGFDPKKLEKLLNYYDELQNTNKKMVEYLDYLAEKVQVVVNENKALKATTNKIIEHTDYLAENIEKTIEYSEYIAENLDKNIEYSEYIAENLDKNIEYSEYIAENLDKNIEYSEYIAENLDKNIEYSEYLAENLEKNIEYSEYLAEHVDGNIAYSEYLAEHVDGNIAYSEYIAENLDDNVAYSEYIAENLDKSISHQSLIVEKLRGDKLFENKFDNFPSLKEAGFESGVNAEEEERFMAKDHEFGDEEENLGPDETPALETEDDFDYTDLDNTTEDDYVYDNEMDSEIEGDSDSELSQSIDKLIEEAKKRKVSETNDLHFLKFLNKSQVDSFYSLTNEEQETAKLHISERSFYSAKDVLSLISESLSAKNETLEERVIRMMPENTKPLWNQMNESSKKSLLSQARLYPEDVLKTESQIEHFWMTRNLKKNESITKKLVSHDALIQEDRLSNNEMDLILEKFKNL